MIDLFDANLHVGLDLLWHLRHDFFWKYVEIWS